MSAPSHDADRAACDEIEITDEMIAAGAAELSAYVHHDVSLILREELAVSVYIAMRRIYSRNSAR
jgi:hypothetical protein